MELSRLARLGRLALGYAPYAGALAVRGLEIVGKLGLFMLAARLLGAHEAGLYFICLTWVGLAATLARAGFEKAAVRHMAAEIALGKTDLARQALLTGLGWTLIGGIAATLATLAAAAPAAHYLFHDPDLAAPLRIAALSILPQALCFYAGHALFGFNRGVAGQFVQNGSWPVFTFAAMAAGAHSLSAMLYALALCNLAATAIGAVLILRAMRDPIPAPQPTTADAPAGALADAPAALPALWRTALPLGMVEVVQVSLNSIPMLLLAVFASAAEVGAFSIANRLSILIWVVIIAIGSIAAPRFAAFHRTGDWAALRAQNRRVRRLVALCSLPPIAIMMLAPAPLLALIGPGFEIAATALVIMAAGQLVNGLLSCQDIMLAMTGHGSLLRWLNVAQFLVCCAAGAVLVPLYGMNGAAILTALVIAQGAIGTALAVRRLMPQAF
ncbi:lipopolysaccharide biosynthesis protein [Ancylobacter radicis]|uniref:Oligosaccharide flippase family protein n=1 Tax=Ancylobacter radicis TaxID=2836179 RepID=A0ABS5R208_9HYPH|nr:oligosaccharide flippase family protein [Ancylobacter radicis]MBS9475701.1 oligosaccharide flippase family protein [Ancylobacter radicis]